MTLDEWKALQASTVKAKPEFKVRLAGEGVDSKQWKKGREYVKKAVESDEEEEESDDEEEDDHRHGKKLLTDIRITFNDNPRGRGRGGRGRGRGGERGAGGDRGGDRGRGSGRGGPGGPRGFGGKPKEAAPRFDDESDFPSLVKLAA